MRLWHYRLIPLLPRQQLLGQHRECCALRGNGWGRKHATVDYIFRHSPYMLVQYHLLVLREMQRRGYRYDALWEAPEYRGKHCPEHWTGDWRNQETATVYYPEHNEAYLIECLDNLHRKGIVVDCPVNISVL